MINKIIIGFIFLNIFCVNAFASQKWDELKTRHFVVYYKDVPTDFVETVGKSAEEYYTEITKNLGLRRFKDWTWDDRAEIYIYDDADDYVKNGNQAFWSHGVAMIRKKRISTYPSAHGFFDSTLPHELGHIIFRELIGFEARLPLWFEEGVAMYQERARRWGSDSIVRKAIDKGTFMDIDKLNNFIPRSKTDIPKIELFYAEAASIVQYIISEFGEYKFERFCQEIKDKRSFKWAFEAVYANIRTMKKLNKKWVEYLEEKKK